MSDSDFVEYQKRLGSHLRLLRNEADLTQEQAAAQVGIGWRHLQKIEAGEVNVSLRTLFLLARAYGVNLSALFAGRGA